MLEDLDFTMACSCSLDYLRCDVATFWVSYNAYMNNTATNDFLFTTLPLDHF